MTHKDTPTNAYSSDAISEIGKDSLIRTLLNEVSDGFLVLDEAGRIVALNQKVGSMFGYEVAELLEESFTYFISPAQRNHYAASLQTYCETGEREFEWTDLRLPGVTSEGTEIPIKVSLQRSDADGQPWLYGTVTDLSQQTEADTVDDSDDVQLSHFVNEIKDYAIYKLDTGGYVQSWNPGLEHLKGYTEAETLGMHFREFYTEEDIAAGLPEQNLTEAVESGHYEGEGWRVRADGSRFWARALITSLWYDDGTLRGFAKITQDLSERHAQEKRLRQERRLLDQLFSTAPMALMVNAPNGDTLRANNRAVELLGLTREEIFGELEDAKQWQLLDSEGNVLKPSEIPRARVLETGESLHNQELVIERPDGTRSWFSVSAAPIFEGGEITRIVTTGEDITELKRLQHELEKERDILKAELDDVLDRITESVFALDEEFNITFVNENMQQLLGQSEAELIGRNYWETVLPDASESLKERYRNAMATQESTVFEVDWADQWFEVHLYPSETGISVYFQDITGRKQQKQALEQANADLENSNKKLERFAYSASHDLQEPLRMISSYLQLLERRYSEELDDDAAEFIDYAVDGAKRMQEMIEGLLTYSRVTRGDEEFESVDCTNVIEQAIEHNRFQIEETDAEITYESLPMVTGNRELLTQLFQNLISNAIKYRGESAPHIEIAGEPQDEGWLFSVADNGIGMNEDDTEAVFEIFKRLHTNAEYSGTGIGLAICKEIVELHDGEIWVESEPNVGSTFYFTLAKNL